MPEVATAVLDELADVSDRAGLWSGAPAALRAAVLAYLADVGLDGLPPVFMIGPTDRSLWATQAVRRRVVAAELLAAVDRSAAPGE